MDRIIDFAKTTGFYMLFGNLKENWTSLAMILISLFLLYLGIKKQFEPLLLVGIAFGMLLTNLTAFTGAENAMYHTELWTQFMDESSEFYHSYGYIMSNGGLLDFLYIGVKTCIYPCLIFIGIGAMTDFEPLIASPKSLLLGAARAGWYIRYIYRLLSACLPGGGCRFDRHYRRCGRSYRHLHHLKALPEPFRPDSGRRLFVYGAGACYSAAYYEAAHHKKGARYSDEAAAQSKQNGKNNFPDCGNRIRGSACSLGYSACWLLNAR